MEHDNLNNDMSPEIEELSALQHKASEFAQDTRTMGDPKPPKKGRGRPKGKKAEKLEATAEATVESETVQAPLDPVLVQFSSQFWGMASQAIATYTTVPETAMQANELAGISQATAAVLQKYLPNVLNKYGAEIMLATAISMYGARVVMVANTELDKRMQEHSDRMHKANDQAAEHTANEMRAPQTPLESHFPLLNN